MKTKAKIPLFSLFLTIFLFSLILPTFASFTVISTEAVGNLDGDEYGSFGTLNHQTFYYNGRMYLLIPSYEGTSSYQLHYFYSDQNDFTTWNDGGSFLGGSGWFTYYSPTKNLITTNGAQYCWVYDDDHDIGHFFYSSMDSSSESLIFYQNFTISDVDGSLTWGSRLTHWDLSTPYNSNRAYVDVCLDPNDANKVVLSIFLTYSDGTSYYRMYVQKFDNYDIYTDNSNTCIYDDIPVSIVRGCSTIIPVESENDTFVIMTGDSYTNRVLYASKIDLGSTTNGSFTWATFSDDSLYREASPNGFNKLYYSWTYNSTHGFISYTANTNQTTNSFIFDFATMTRGTEYISIDYTPVTSDYSLASIIHDDNEPFSLALQRTNTNTYTGWINEYNEVGYSIWDLDSQQNITNAYTQADAYTFESCETYPFTLNGTAFFFFNRDDDQYVTLLTLNGEFAEEEPNVINDLIDLVIVISVPLILILFCGGLGYQFGGGFGGLVGVNVGVLLSVLFLSWPIYTLVLLVMVDIYAVFKGGNF